MFFKRIEMVGFKSFATRTVCEFLPGTTVVVGPNGCGKSNILDSIKWVLGEQAVSQLRGKKMQDVIFAGSASLKALGVAQVTLTIDNTKRILPIEFDEVQITRRLMRTGESEYLLNKQACRLKDIHTLFLGTGIGKSAYSMLEQGRVDQIVNAKPQDRRFLIEEAAGISKFKLRKVEALRKLERTDTDLTHFGNLIGEVDRNVASLKRQASKAERYKSLIEACQTAERELMVIRSSELRGKLAEKSHEFETVRDEHVTMRAELDKRMIEQEELRDREAELNDRITDEGSALYDLKANLGTCQNQITNLNYKIQTNTDRIGKIQDEFRELDQRAQDIELQLVEAEHRLAEASKRREENQAVFEEKTRLYKELEARVREGSSRIEELSTSASRLRDELARAESELSRGEMRIQNQDETRREAEAMLEALEEKFGRHKAEFETLASRLEALTAQIQSAAADLTQQRDAQRERQTQLGGSIKELEQVSRELHAGRSRLDTLNELKASYEGFYQGVREVMQAADRREVSGLIGVAAELIRAKSEHETAIEVALATHLQDIVAHTAEDARNAIYWLKSSGRGRATFLPLDRLQTQQLHPNLRQALGRPGVVGLASELVDFDPRIRIAVDFMLGTTIVVQTLDVGLELGRQGMRGRFVSLDGQLINPGGAMTGGRVQASGLMTREREIRDLAEAVARNEKRGEELRRRVERLQIEMSTGATKIEALQMSLDQQRLEENGLRKDLQSAERQRDEAKTTLDERFTQLERMEAESGALRESIESLRAVSAEHRAGLEAAEGALTEERNQARGHSDEYINLGTARAEARSEVEKAREQIEQAGQKKQYLERDMEGIGRSRQARLRDIEELQAEEGRIQEQIARIQEEMQATQEEFNKLSLRHTEDQTAREELTARVKQLSQDLQVMQRDEKILSDRFHELDLVKTELEVKALGLNEQCIEKFQTELETLCAEVGEVQKDPHGLHVEVTEMRDRLSKIGLVNMAALEEYEEQRTRLEFLQAQHRDLSEAKETLVATIARLDETTRKLFHETFEKVRINFIDMFRKLFNGGKADLILDAPDGVDPLLDGGVEIVAQPPGKKLQSITLMSGGEKALTAIAMLFGLFLYKPSPFCILDEIDAPLDDINVNRFKSMVEDFKMQTQFLIITHNKLTMELADALYGVTMEESGVSKLVSVRFDQAEHLVEVV